jgi:SAM-dependent methyltransferase
MANEFRGLEAHSAEYFGETRDYWWNLDFLELIGRRFRFEAVADVLDAGCGIGHWGQTLANVLPRGAGLRGVDRDPLWVEKAAARAAALGLDGRFGYQAGVAEKLPFADASFDLVTCQTLLIHAPDPGAVIGEMIRVARPGALVLAVEPNNVAGALTFDSLSFGESAGAILARARLQLVCERGKAALGEGHNSIGELVPGLLAASGLVDVQVYLNDKANAFLPSYGTPEQRAGLEESDDHQDREFWIWSLDDTRRYFIAGGGRSEDFETLWAHTRGGRDAFEAAVRNHTYSSAGGSLTYLAGGRKPAGA